MDDIGLQVIERAVLREALAGATRTELWLATRTALMFASEEQFRMVMTRLAGEGDLDLADGRWMTTERGRDRLQRLRA